MQKSDYSQAAKTAHRRAQTSTTLNRKYVKRPSTNKHDDTMIQVRKSSQIKRFNDVSTMRPRTQIGRANNIQARKSQIEKKNSITEEIERHPVQNVVNAKMRSRNSMMQTTKNPQAQKMNAQELKDRAIKKALASASTITDDGISARVEDSDTLGPKKPHFGIGRILLALSCATVAVLAIVYFVNLNMPDISFRVAAMQTGIDAAYPGYLPKDYAISSITSENGKIVLNFTKSSTGESFTLTEEKSTWDSNALLSNFVKEAYKEDYSIIREQGITIYVSEGNATWVNGGIVYKIEAKDKLLTEKQIRSIAISL